MTLAALSLRRPVTTVAATLALPVLTVRTAYPGAAAAEVSRLVAKPIEEALAGAP